MDAIVKKFYAEYRKEGNRADTALAYAKIRKQWEALESAGFVRLVYVPDDDTFDDSYIDTWTDVSEERRERWRKELWEQIERDGVWGLCGEFRLDVDDDYRWDSGDAIFGLVGQDDCGYAPGIMQGTIEALRVSLKSRCTCCHRPV